MGTVTDCIDMAFREGSVFRGYTRMKNGGDGVDEAAAVDCEMVSLTDDFEGYSDTCHVSSASHRETARD